jgi:hypothetical protein
VGLPPSAALLCSGGLYRRQFDEAGSAEVLWLVPGPGVERPLLELVDQVDPEAELMAIEQLPAACLIYVR